MKLYYPLAIDMYKNFPLVVLTAQQGNVGRGAIVTLTAGGEIIDPTEEEVEVYAKKPDGTVSWLECVVEDSKVKVDFTNEMLSYPGMLQVELRFKNDPEDMTTPIFLVDVKKSNVQSAGRSKNELPVLDQIIKTANEAKKIAEDSEKELTDINEDLKYRIETFESHRILNNTAWDVKNIQVGIYLPPRLEPIKVDGYFTFEHKVKKGDFLKLPDTSVYALMPTEFSDSLIVTDTSLIVKEVVHFDDLTEAKKYTFTEDGYIFLCAKCAENTSIEMFYLISPNKYILSPSNAEVGQILEVESVDENGFPTKWKTVESPTYYDMELLSKESENTTIVTGEDFPVGTELLVGSDKAGWVYRYTNDYETSNVMHETPGKEKITLEDGCSYTFPDGIFVLLVNGGDPKRTVDLKIELEKQKVSLKNANKDVSALQLSKAGAIIETASGNPIILTDSAESEPISLEVYGKSEQTQLSGKNKLDCRGLVKSTINGVTFTPVYDETGYLEYINIDGTATDITYLDLNTDFDTTLEGGVFRGLPRDIVADVTSIITRISTQDSRGSVQDLSNGVELANNGSNLRIAVRVAAGYTAANLKIYPMICLKTDDSVYEPYCGGVPSPNPDYPQEIVNVGAYDEASGKYAVEIKATGKNLFNNNFSSKTMNGITFTVNKDGTITANGTSTDVAYIETTIELAKNTDYVLSGCPSGGGWETHALYIMEMDKYVTTFNDHGQGNSFNSNQFERFLMRCRIGKGVTISNLVFKPMIRYAEIADDTYEPYKETTITVHLDEPLRKGDIICKKDGVWGVERHSVGLILDGTQKHAEQVDLGNVSRVMVDLPSDKYAKGNNSTDKCDKLVYKLTYSDDTEHFYIQNKVAWLFIANENLEGYDTIKSYLAVNPLTVEYELATPTFTPFEDQNIFDGLSMQYPVTVLGNDFNTDMTVKYIADTKSYIDKKFAELAAAAI